MKRKWIIRLRLLLGIVIMIQIVTIIGMSIKVNSKEGLKIGELFKDPLFLFMRLVGDFSTLCFLIIGMFLTTRIKNIPRGTEYE